MFFLINKKVLPKKSLLFRGTEVVKKKINKAFWALKYNFASKQGGRFDVSAHRHYNYKLADFSWVLPGTKNIWPFCVNLPGVITEETGLCSSLSMFFLKR